MIFPSGDDNCVSTGKERADRQVQSQNRFDSLQLDVKCADTAVLLLGSRERPILLAAAAALTKFAAKGKDHLQTLFQLDVIDSLMPLIDHDDLSTRRFAMRLLGEMAALSFVRNHLFDSPSCIPNFTKILINDPDMFMQEYALLILAEISKEAYGTVKLSEQCSAFDFLFEKIKQSDPDIKKNTIEIMDNLLKDPVAAENIVASQAFSLPPIYHLLEEPYPAIQTLALSVIKSLVTRGKDERIQNLFQQSNGAGVLLDLLENVELANLHPDVLSIFMHVVENPKTIEFLSLDGGIAKLFKYHENTTKSLESRQILDVLVRLSNTQLGRKTLHNYGIVSTLIKYWHSSRDSEVRRIACYGIGMMSQHEPAAKEIIRENPIRMILELLKDDSEKWRVRETAAFALKQLCISDQKNCQFFLDIKGQSCLYSLLMQPFGKVPLEIAISAADILTTIGGYPDLRERLIEAQLIDALCFPFEVKNRAVDELKIACCKALSVFCVENRARKLCLAKNFVKKVYPLLQASESIPVRAAAVQLVQQLCRNYVMAEQFVHAGFLNYMLNNRSASRVVPSWETCIEALFSAHLPIKFAATGRLSLHDITQDGFYIMRRRHICPFPILDELFRLKMCPMEPIYVVNFAKPEVNVNGKEEAARASVNGQNSFQRSSAWLDVKFSTLQTDSYLYGYLELFKCILVTNESNETCDVRDAQLTQIENADVDTPRDTCTLCDARNKLNILPEIDEEIWPIVVNISKIASRARLLGRFVARQMSGPDPGYPCLDHQLEIHVQEIREDLQTSVIPLGQLRVGSYLERALLFKVMADRICLPAALVRGEYGKAWVQIAIPEIENPVENADMSSLPDVLKPILSTSRKSLWKAQRKSGSIESPNITQSIHQEDSNRINVIENNVKTILPTRLLCENYIVDLVEKPGDLIAIESARARTYCSPVSHYGIPCAL